MTDEKRQREDDGRAFTDLEDDVLEAVESRGPLTLDEITETVGRHSHVEIVTAARRLEQKGHLSSDENDVYRPASPENR